jgi:hypothetical protein
MKLRKKRRKNDDDKWDLLDLFLELIEPIFLLVRFIIRIIVKIVH